MARCIERNLGREPVNVSPLDGRDRPMTGTERRLAAMWEEVLEVRPVGVRDDFFDLGGRASHVERLFSRIQSAFGEGLPIRALNEAPTVEELARLIDGTDRAQSTLIAPLQTDGSGPPLFAIHAGAGYVFFYRSLAHRLRPAIPVYAVQAQGHLGDRQRPYATTPSIEALAARYVCEIRAIRPSGPYHLAGASFGGVVAFEMARQLRAAGERVSSLFLFSPHIRNNPHAKRRAAGAGGPDRERFEECPWPRRLARHLARCSRLEAEEAAQYVAEKTRGQLRHFWKLARGADRPIRRVLAESAREIEWQWRHLCGRAVPAEMINARFMTASHAMILRYRPGDYDGRAVLFRAARDEDPVPLWDGLARGGLEVYDTPGGHLEMLDEPTVEWVADIISQRIQEADAVALVSAARAAATASRRACLQPAPSSV
jgi:thioesterase domain-containing protein